MGIQTDAFTEVNRFGTPHSEAMHIVERFRLIDGGVAKAQIDKFETSEGTVGAGARVQVRQPLRCSPRSGAPRPPQHLGGKVSASLARE